MSSHAANQRQHSHQDGGFEFFLEADWHEYFFNLWSHSFRLIVIGLTICSTILYVLYLLQSDADMSAVRLPGYLGEEEAMGKIGASSVHVVPVLVGWSLSLLMLTPLYCADHYPLFVASFAVCFVFSHGIAAHIIQLMAVFDGQTDVGQETPVFRVELACLGDNNGASSSCASGHDAATRWVPMETIVRRGAFHVGNALLGYLGVALFLPYPLVACAINMSIAASNIARAQFLWRRMYGINLLSATWPFHIITLALATGAAYFQRRLVQEQFWLRKSLQQAKDDRIEQLGCEKERLDYERAMAVKKQAARGHVEGASVPPSAQSVSRESNGIDESSKQSSELSKQSTVPASKGRGSDEEETEDDDEDDELEDDDDEEERQQEEAEEDREAVSSCSARSRPSVAYEASLDSAPTTLSQLALPSLASRCASKCAASSVGSDTTCSELDRLTTNRAYSAARGQPTRTPRVSFCLLPQYYTEEGDETVLWLTDVASRAKYRLHVCDGLLCHSDQQLLGHHDPGSSMIFIFVVDVRGDVMVALKSDETLPRVHHSSLVAGAAVSAAGEMCVQSGQLLWLSNWSGHYAPPPSSLAVILDRIACMGVRDVKNVALELIGAPTAHGSNYSTGALSDCGEASCSQHEAGAAPDAAAPAPRSAPVLDAELLRRASNIGMAMWDPASALRTT